MLWKRASSLVNYTEVGMSENREVDRALCVPSYRYFLTRLTWLQGVVCHEEDERRAVQGLGGGGKKNVASLRDYASLFCFSLSTPPTTKHSWSVLSRTKK